VPVTRIPVEYTLTAAVVRVREHIMNSRRYVVGFCVAIFFSASTLLASDTILIHGCIYTGNPKALWAQAVAITGSRIDAVGSDGEILSRTLGHAQIIDLHGQTVVPGFSDSHTHMWFGGLELHGLNLSTPEGTITPEDDPEELVKRLKEYAVARPNGKVL